MSEKILVPIREEPSAHKVPPDTAFHGGASPTDSPAGTSAFGVVLLFTLALAAAGYSYHERNVARELAESNRVMAATLNATRDQLNALTAKVKEMETKPSPETARKTEPEMHPKPLTAAVRPVGIEDPRWKKMQGQLTEQGKAIAWTREDLEDTRTELEGSIAKTHDEVVVLRKKGERNYYEFEANKGNGFERQGPVRVRLRKANPKQAYADLELMVDDFKVSKKHVNVDEPIVLYPGDEKLPVELVINSIGKNHIHGYVSAPKHRSSDLEAMASSVANAQATTTARDPTSSDAKPSPARRKLPQPAQ